MRYLHTPQALDDAIPHIRSAPWAAVDTEADSLHHYVEKLCLLQVSVPRHDFVIDTLAPLSLAPLVRVLNDKFLIFHGADFDIRMIRKHHLFEPKMIFDTLLAAQLLGCERQGLADLAERYCGARLSKSGQKADWSERPLDPKLLEYAANDTHYLGEISFAMEKGLAALGRLEWHRQSCRKLLQAVLAPREEKGEDDQAWRIKGSGNLKGRALTYLKELWRWREETARRRDRPPFKIVNSETLLEVARWAAVHPGEDVALLPKAPRNLKHGEYRQAVNDTLHRANALPQAVLTTPNGPGKTPRRPRRRWTEEDQKKFEALKAERERKSHELKIHPSVLATNAALEAVAAARPRDRRELERLGCLLPWQAEILFDTIIK